MDKLGSLESTGLTKDQEVGRPPQCASRGGLLPVCAALEVDALTKKALDPPQVLLAFSFKEAVYKAIDPFLERFVSFQVPHSE